MKKAALSVTAMVATVIVASTADAGTSFVLEVNTSDSSITFVNNGITAIYTTLNFSASCSGTVSPSWPTGTLTVSSCAQATTSVSTTPGAATAYVSASGGEGDFNTDKHLFFEPELTIEIVANNDSFDCSMTFTSGGSGLPDFTHVMSPTLPLPPPSFTGTLVLGSTVGSPGFAVTTSCSSTVASELDDQFATLYSASLDSTYEP